MQWYLVYIVLLTAQAAVFRDGKRSVRRDGDRIGFVRRNGNHLFLALACIELIVLTGLRGYTVGADTDTYLDALRHYTGISFAEVFTKPLVYPFDFEIGYFVLTKLCAWMHMSETVFLFLIAIAVYVPLFRYIYLHSTHPYISVLVYFAFGFFSYSLGIYRQFIAIGIVLSVLKYIERRQFWPYFLAILLAMLIHQTAFIALPLYFLPVFRWRKPRFFLTVLAAEVVLLAVGRYVIRLAVSLFPAYAGYLGSQYDTQGGSYLNLIFLNLVYFLVCLANRQAPEKDVRLNMIAAQLAVASLLQCCAYHMALFGRIVPYYSIALLLAIPNVIDGFSRKDPAMAYVLKLAACAILLLLTVLEFSGNNYVCPFYFFWQAAPA